MFPPTLASALAALHHDPSLQSSLATWIEVFYYEYYRRDVYENRMDQHQERYEEAWDKLLASGVLEPAERSEHMAAALCSPSAIETARRMYERRRYSELGGYRGGCAHLDGTKWSRSGES